MERETGLEPATACLEGRNSTRLSYSRLPFKYTELRGLSLRLRFREIHSLSKHGGRRGWGFWRYARHLLSAAAAKK